MDERTLLLPILHLHLIYAIETYLGEEEASTVTQEVEFHQLPQLTLDHFQDQAQFQSNTTSKTLIHMTV